MCWFLNIKPKKKKKHSYFFREDKGKKKGLRNLFIYIL